MFGKFGGQYINFKAVSEIILIEQSGDFCKHRHGYNSE